MSMDEAALAGARARAGGPYQVPAGSAPVPGTERLVEPGGELVWLVPHMPDSADARVLAELNLDAVPVDQPNDTARMLAACLRCCWPDPGEPPWPGVPVARAKAITLFRELTAGREADAQHRAAVSAVSRLTVAGWLLADDRGGTLRLGPRVALWSPADLPVLRQLWHAMPRPEVSGA
jgi:hypothetical protein